MLAGWKAGWVVAALSFDIWSFAPVNSERGRIMTSAAKKIRCPEKLDSLRFRLVLEV